MRADDLRSLRSQGVEILYTPSVSANGSMTVSSLSITHAGYRWLNHQLYELALDINFTLGGTASNLLFITLPVNHAASAYLRESYFSFYDGTNAIYRIYPDQANTTRIILGQLNGGNLTLGATRYVRLTVIIPTA